MRLYRGPDAGTPRCPQHPRPTTRRAAGHRAARGTAKDARQVVAVHDDQVQIMQDDPDPVLGGQCAQECYTLMVIGHGLCRSRHDKDIGGPCDLRRPEGDRDEDSRTVAQPYLAGCKYLRGRVRDAREVGQQFLHRAAADLPGREPRKVRRRPGPLQHCAPAVEYGGCPAVEGVRPTARIRNGHAHRPLAIQRRTVVPFMPLFTHCRMPASGRICGYCRSPRLS